MEWSPVFVFDIADSTIAAVNVRLLFCDLVAFSVRYLPAGWCGVGWAPPETSAWSLLPLCPCLHRILSESLTAAVFQDEKLTTGWDLHRSIFFR